MLNRPTPTVRRVEPQRPLRRNDQGRQEERPQYTEQNTRQDRDYCNRRNNNLYSDEEELEDEEYRGNNRYNKGGRRYNNRRFATNRGGFNGPRPQGHNRQYKDQCWYDKSSEDERRQETHREPRQPPRNNRRLQQNRDEQAIATETATPPERETSESSVHCFVCQQPGHYATQCPLRKGKGPTVNTITVEVQQVTTRQQTKNADLVVQEEIRKAAQAWVEKANAANTECMR